MQGRNGIKVVSVAVVIATVLAGCTGTSEGDKAGGDATPVTLRLGTMEGEGAPYTAHVEEFARQAEELSGGGIHVEVVWDAAVQFFGEFGAGAEQQVAELVQSGDKLDMALIPARAWDELGVTSLQALQAPFLVSSEELVGRVVQSDLATDMLTGLDGSGVIGLSLWPEGLRHPVGFQRPLRAPKDFHGDKIRAPQSKATYQLLEALGAEPVDLPGQEFVEAVVAGDVVGAESGFAWGGDLPAPGTFTANVTFFPKVNALVANEASFGDLSEEQRSALRDAATAAMSFALHESPAEEVRAREYCGLGGRIVFASEADVRALEAAAAPVYTTLQSDAQTATFIERIRSMKADLPAPSFPQACDPEQESTGSGGTAGAFPQGTYRVEFSADFLIGLGMDAMSANDQAGVQTLTMEDGRWHHVILNSPPECEGTYTVEDGRLLLSIETAICGAPVGGIILDATWDLEGDQLRFTDVRSGIGDDPFAEIVWGGKPWTKIG